MSTYSYSINEEGPFFGEFSTPEDAAQEAFSTKDENVIWVGENMKYTAHDFVNGQSILEDIQVQADDECGEWSGDWLTTLLCDKEKCKSLEKIIGDWIEENETLTFFTVQDVREIKRSETGESK